MVLVAAYNQRRRLGAAIPFGFRYRLEVFALGARSHTFRFWHWSYLRLCAHLFVELLYQYQCSAMEAAQD